MKKLADFLSRDFRQAPNRAAAAKNAFVLLGQHRYELATMFFILGVRCALHLTIATLPILTATASQAALYFDNMVAGSFRASFSCRHTA